LLATDKVAARVAWLKAQIAAQVMSARVMTLTEVLEELSKLGRSSLQHMVVGGDNTAEVVESLRNLPPEHAAAIKTLTIETYVEGHGDAACDVKKVRLELHDKRGALAELRRALDPTPQRIADPDGRPVGTAAAEQFGEQIEKLSELDLARRIAFALERAARANPASAADTLAGGAKAQSKPQRKPKAVKQRKRKQT
jgi:hypothetical protein